MVKTIYDYIPTILQKFPYLSTKEIENILFRGFRLLHGLSKLRFSFHFRYEENNTLLRFFFGNIKKTAEQSLKEFLKKILRLCFMRKEQTDEFFYTAVNKEKHNKLLSLGEIKTFENVMFFRYKYQLKSAPKETYIWKIKENSEWKKLLYINTYSTKEAYFYGSRS